MRARTMMSAVAVLAACGCNQSPNEPSPSNVQAPAKLPANEAAPEPAAQPVANEAQANDTAPLPEPKGPIDPNSAEAAGQVVQHYGALIERSRWLKAERLWGDLQAARAFATALGGQFREVHLEIGNPGDTEGAAGSIYTTVPVTFYGQTKRGTAARRKADVILRRINDVPGSTEAQRRWHIERIDWK